MNILVRTITFYFLLVSTTSIQASNIPLLNSFYPDFVQHADELLKNQQYDQLNALLSPCLDPDNLKGVDELDCNSRLLVFDRIDLQLLELLILWLKKEPDNYIALINMANLTYEFSYVIRGGNYLNKTHPLDIAAFNKGMYDALTYLKKARSIAPELPFAWALSISMRGRLCSSCQGEIKSEDQLFELALKYVPSSYLVYQDYIHVNWPRWNGSHQKIESIVKQSIESKQDNPLLAELTGEATYALAYDYYTGFKGIEKDSQKAFDLFTQASKEAPNQKFMSRRILILKNELGLLTSQDLEDIDEAIARLPYSEKLTNLKGSILRKENRNKELIDLRKQYIKFHPDDFNAALQLGYMLATDKHYEQALPILKRGAKSRPYDFQLNLWLRKVEIALNQSETEIFQDKAFLVNFAAYNFAVEKTMKDANINIKGLLAKNLSKEDALKAINWVDKLEIAKELRLGISKEWNKKEPNIPAYLWLDLSTAFAEDTYCACYIAEKFKKEQIARMDTENNKEVKKILEQYARRYYETVVERAIQEKFGINLIPI